MKKAGKVWNLVSGALQKALELALKAVTKLLHLPDPTQLIPSIAVPGSVDFSGKIEGAMDNILKPFTEVINHVGSSNPLWAEVDRMVDDLPGAPANASLPDSPAAETAAETAAESPSACLKDLATQTKMDLTDLRDDIKAAADDLLATAKRPICAFRDARVSGCAKLAKGACGSSTPVRPKASGHPSHARDAASDPSSAAMSKKLETFRKDVQGLIQCFKSVRKPFDTAEGAFNSIEKGSQGLVQAKALLGTLQPVLKAAGLIPYIGTAFRPVNSALKVIADPGPYPYPYPYQDLISGPS